MGMGNYGCSADTVSDDFVKKHCPETFEAFEKVLDEAEVEIDDFFVAQYFEGEYEQAKEDFDVELIDKAYDVLKDDFEKKTGLYLSTVYHDAEERSDELDGGAWAVDGVYIYSPAGEKYKDEIQHKDWTVYG